MRRKWVKLEKHHPKLGNPQPKKQMCYVFIHKWILIVKCNHTTMY